MQREFLDRLGDDERAGLIARLVTRRYGRGETVIAQSDDDRDIYFVLGGLARAMIFSQDGKLVAFRDIGGGRYPASSRPSTVGRARPAWWPSRT